LLFLFLLDRKIKHGPDVYEDTDDVYSQQKYIFEKN